MMRVLHLSLAAASLIGLLISGGPALAQKSGGILRIYHRDTPPSGSILEEATNSTLSPYMGVFNNLVMFDQHKPTNSIDTIIPMAPIRSRPNARRCNNFPPSPEFTRPPAP